MFVGDSINNYLSEICTLLCSKYNITSDVASKYIIVSKFYLLVRNNFMGVKEKSPEFWTDTIYYRVQSGETF